MGKSVRKLPGLTLLVLGLILLMQTENIQKVTADQQVVVSRIAQNADGKRYMEVDGKPFLYHTVQNCGGCMLRGGHEGDSDPVTGYPTPLSMDRLENCYEKQAALNFKVISQIIEWRDWEPVSQGIYDWTLINKYIDWANKYDLRIDFALFGSDGCGGTRLPGYTNGYKCQVPEYLRDHKYWQGTENPNGEIFPHWPINDPTHGADAQYLHDCEIAAVTALFNHLAEYDTNHRVISFQLNNEVWGSNIPWCNDMGYAIKNSNYSVVTRLNYAGAGYYSNAWNQLYIDTQGADPYTSSVNTIKSLITEAAGYGKMAYIAENGPYSNSTSLILTAIVNGGFYSAWELMDYWWGGYYSCSFRDMVLGTPAPMKSQAILVKNLNAAMNKIGSLIAETSKTKMAGFNIATDNPASSCSDQKSVGGYSITYVCSDASVGMAVTKDGFVYCMSDTAGSVIFKTTQQPISASVGYMDANGNWVNQGSRSYTNNGDGTYSITYNSQACLRLEFPVSPTPTPDPSNTLLSHNKPATASSTGGAGQEPGKAVDGLASSSGTKWSSQLGETSWLQVDLGQAYNITRYVVKHANPFETWQVNGNINTVDFKFQVSSDGSNWMDVDTVTGNTADVTDHNISANGRYVRLYITNPQAYSQYRGARIYEFEVYGNTGGGATPTPTPSLSNLALNKTATASSTGATGQEPNKAVDGLASSSGTKWSSQLGETSWLQVDLGQTYNITRYVVKHANPFETWQGSGNINTVEFKFQVSSDGSSWMDVDTVTGNAANVTDHNVSANGRYVRLYITNPQAYLQYRGARIYEFEVYGR